MVRRLTVLMVFLSAISVAHSDEKFTLPAEFSLLTSANAPGYFKPIFTTVHQGFNSNLFNTARYQKDSWSFGLNISVQGMLIPESQTTYTAKMPSEFGNTSITETLSGNGERNTTTVEQPTIYGGAAVPVFGVPQTQTLSDQAIGRSVTFPAGQDASLMFGLPNIQFVLGLPTQTQVRFMALPASADGRSLMFVRVGVNQQIDQYFNLFGRDTTLALAVNAGYNMISWDQVFDMSSIAFGVHASKQFGQYSLVSGFQIETLSGTFEAERDQDISGAATRSPYAEIRNGDPLKFDIESFNTWRFMVGGTARFGAVEFHGDAAWASQPQLSAGVTFWFAQP